MGPMGSHARGCAAVRREAGRERRVGRGTFGTGMGVSKRTGLWGVPNLYAG
jgi:hypothetical protein